MDPAYLHTHPVAKERDSPVTLHCPCGQNFGCLGVEGCGPGCPWSGNCIGKLTRRGHPIRHSLETLCAICPSCGSIHSYERGGHPSLY